MNVAALTELFDSTFSGVASGQHLAYSGSGVMPDLFFRERMFSGGAFVLSAVVGSASEAQVIRSLSFSGSGSGIGVKLPPEKGWDTTALTSYFQSQMDSIYSALPATTQAMFAQEYTATKDFLSRGQTEVAQAIISGTAVTDELQATKELLLSFF
jgi:hypothetical protein